MKKLKPVIIVLFFSIFLIINLAEMIRFKKNSSVEVLRKSNQDSETVNQQIRNIITLADSFKIDIEQKIRGTK